ncbi:rubrerythrin family protein [Clostridium fallax]|uniref:Rubrerythrin n=1 Tax=Clostridium fallax TaxID=1533 RepID=A0A1M4SSQ7_9CLOT|nr:rubrerythrin family protein [Clostridium fallax]SHE35218.1 Rubrerythrin [Clostridium fallax]SQB07952.1 rubrerythrin [Clostridium fallax]
MDISGTKTEKNLLKTFAGESRARNRYDLYSEKANQEGYYWIAKVFNETALNEFAHAREVFKRYLKMINSTEQNLLSAAMGENEEAESIYKDFENTARMEGFNDIADFFKELREVEESHKERFMMLYEGLKNKNLYNSNKEDTMWKCLNCGYIHIGKNAPEICPLCKFPRGYFKLYCKCEKK